MTGTADNKGKPAKTWPAEMEIEAYRKDLEASFLLEQGELQSRRKEVVERLDQMEANTLANAHEERRVLKARQDQIMDNIKTILDQRFQVFLSGFDRKALLEELTRQSLSFLCSASREAEGMSR